MLLWMITLCAAGAGGGKFMKTNNMRSKILNSLIITNGTAIAAATATAAATIIVSWRIGKVTRFKVIAIMWRWGEWKRWAVVAMAKTWTFTLLLGCCNGRWWWLLVLKMGIKHVPKSSLSSRVVPYSATITFKHFADLGLFHLCVWVAAVVWVQVNRLSSRTLNLRCCSRWLWNSMIDGRGTWIVMEKDDRAEYSKLKDRLAR